MSNEELERKRSTLSVKEGDRFGRLTIVRVWARARHKIPRCDCRCCCGNLKDLRVQHLVARESLSCGCLRNENISRVNTTHGKSLSPTYSSWQSMKWRCKSKHSNYFNRSYAHYCARWESFENFLADMGERPEGTSLDRIDNKRGYSPENCRWASARQQSCNRSNVNLLEFRGEHLSITEIAERVGLHYRTLRARLLRGWSLERATNTPVK